MRMETEHGMISHQKRHWLRSYTDAPIWFAGKGALDFVKGRLRNKSPAGACFLSGTRFSPQTEMVVRMTAPGTGNSAATASIRAIVKWQRDHDGKDGPCYQIGVQFVNRPPAGWF